MHHEMNHRSYSIRMDPQFRPLLEAASRAV
jgi:hypothetical protein